MLIVIVSDCSVVLVLVVADLTVLEEGGGSQFPQHALKVKLKGWMKVALNLINKTKLVHGYKLPVYTEHLF